MPLICMNVTAEVAIVAEQSWFPGPISSWCDLLNTEKKSCRETAALFFFFFFPIINPRYNGRRTFGRCRNQINVALTALTVENRTLIQIQVEMQVQIQSQMQIQMQEEIQIQIQAQVQIQKLLSNINIFALKAENCDKFPSWFVCNL